MKPVTTLRSQEGGVIHSSRSGWDEPWFAENCNGTWCVRWRPNGWPEDAALTLLNVKSESEAKLVVDSHNFLLEQLG